MRELVKRFFVVKWSYVIPDVPLGEDSLFGTVRLRRS